MPAPEAIRSAARFLAPLCLAVTTVAGAQNPLRHYTEAFELRAGPAHPVINYLVKVAPGDTLGWTVELRLRNAPDSFRLAMAAHPEYDDRFWRFLTALRIESPQAGGGARPRIEREDSAVWRVTGSGGEAVVRYRIALPPPEGPPRAAWRPFLTSQGGLLGGPHTFLYPLGAELAPVHVRFELPPGWDIATGLTPTADPLTFFAPSTDVLVDSPVLAGRFSSWTFRADEVPHRVVYWPGPAAAGFDTTRFVAGIERLVIETIRLFGRAPYRDYHFLFQDASYGGLEHLNSVTLGAPTQELARNPASALPETAHEFVHTWNLMRIRPAEYRAVDHRTQRPVAGLWFSEGFTMFYADLLLRRAGLPTPDSTRLAHLERQIARYLASPGNSHHSAETVSRVAYNAPPGSLGDYSASSHLQGELIAAILDLEIRNASGGARSLDDLMRLMLERHGGAAGFEGPDVERAVEDLCSCDVTPFFEAHVRGGGRPIDFDRYLALLGLRTRVTWGPAVWNGQPERDLRIFGWEPPGESAMRLVITDPGSIWGRAGFHSGDRLLRVNGEPVSTWPAFRGRVGPLRMGDTIRLEVQRPGGTHAATVTITGFQRPSVRIEEIPGASPAQLALRRRWIEGR